MRVVDYINGADPALVAALYAEQYEADCWSTPEAFSDFRKALNDKVGIHSDMRVVLTRYYKEWDDPILGVEDYIDVSGENPEGRWAIEFNPWGQWKLMEVDDRTGKNLSTDEIATHIYYEITWGGDEESSQARLAEIEDRMEEVERGIAKLTPIERLGE